MSRHTSATAVAVAVLVIAALSLSACAPAMEGAAPSCDSVQRVAIVAQSVPDASYVPCLEELPAGWHSTSFEVKRGGTRFSLVSDRAPSSPVQVALVPACDVGDAAPSPPRADGVRTFLVLDTLSPRFTGTLYDVFPGGCVTYRFDFARGSHIGLTDDFESAVGLLARREVRLRVHRELGVDLDP